MVEDAREITSFFRLTAAEEGWRIVIVDGAEEMNRNAANALLKVLEEPPRQALLLLVSHSPGRLLPTIRSRCRRFPLVRWRRTVVMRLLQRYRPELPQPEAEALAALVRWKHRPRAGARRCRRARALSVDAGDVVADAARSM